MPTSHLGSRCMSKHITQSKSRLFFGSLADKTTRSRLFWRRLPERPQAAPCNSHGDHRK